jgi:hypothetical protein
MLHDGDWLVSLILFSFILIVNVIIVSVYKEVFYHIFLIFVISLTHLTQVLDIREREIAITTALESSLFSVILVYDRKLVEELDVARKLHDVLNFFLS